MFKTAIFSRFKNLNVIEKSFEEYRICVVKNKFIILMYGYQIIFLIRKIPAK